MTILQRDFTDFDSCVLLSMTSNFVNPLLGFEPNRNNFVAFDVGFYDFCRHLGAFDSRRPDGHVVAVDSHQGLEFRRLFGFDKVDIKYVAFGDEILLVAS